MNKKGFYIYIYTYPDVSNFKFELISLLVTDVDLKENLTKKINNKVTKNKDPYPLNCFGQKKFDTKDKKEEYYMEKKCRSIWSGLPGQSYYSESCRGLQIQHTDILQNNRRGTASECPGGPVLYFFPF